MRRGSLLVATSHLYIKTMTKCSKAHVCESSLFRGFASLSFHPACYSLLANIASCPTFIDQCPLIKVEILATSEQHRRYQMATVDVSCVNNVLGVVMSLPFTENKYLHHQHITVLCAQQSSTPPELSHATVKT